MKWPRILKKDACQRITTIMQSKFVNRGRSSHTTGRTVAGQTIPTVSGVLQEREGRGELQRIKTISYREEEARRRDQRVAAWIVTPEITHEKFEPVESGNRMENILPPPRRKRKKDRNSFKTINQGPGIEQWSGAMCSHFASEVEVETFPKVDDELEEIPEQNDYLEDKSQDSCFGVPLSDLSPPYSASASVVNNSVTEKRRWDVVLEKESDENRMYHDQLTISKHYLNEDVLVWTF